MDKSRLYIDVIDTEQKEQLYRPGIRSLLSTYEHVLLDDFSRCPSVRLNVDFLLNNTFSCVPWLWVIAEKHNEATTVYAASGLADISVPCHATIHGVSHPLLRRSPVLADLKKRVFQAAFKTLRLKKLKAVFEESNKGAKGFCWQNGFVKEGCLKQEVLMNGVLQNVMQYALFSTVWQHC